MKKLIGLILILVALTAGAGTAIAQWSEPVNVSRLTTGVVAWYPSLAIDSFGTLHASWSHRLNNDCDWIEYSCKPANADTWSVPVRVSRESAWVCGSVVAVGPGHVPHVVWQCETEAGYLYICHKSADTWTIPERLTGWNAVGSGIRACSDVFDRVHVVWYDGRVIWYARYDAAGWSRPETAITYTTHGVGYPDVAADRQGFCHVVYATFHDTVGYVHQTPSGWSAPEHLTSGVGGGAREPRIDVDTLGQPQAAWWDYWHTTFCARSGDTWTRPQYLDSIWGGTPSVCVDSWNRTHIFFDDGSETRHVGLRERVWYQSRWTEAFLVDTMEGWGEPVASRGNLHFLWNKQAPSYRDVWYSRRMLSPPSVAELPSPASIELQQPSCIVVVPSTQVWLNLDKSGIVVIDILDSTGRVIKQVDVGFLEPGRHQFEPYVHLPGAGVFFCRVPAGTRTKTVKLVRVN